MSITLYGASWCGGCRRAKKYLDENNVDYEYKDVDDESNMEEVRDLGYSSIPVLDLGDETIVGFDKDRYEELL